MTITGTVWFEFFRLIALALIYCMFFLNLWTVRITYQQIRQWSREEQARQERWREDSAAITKMREEAYHLRAQAEVALAQARRHLPGVEVER